MGKMIYNFRRYFLFITLLLFPALVQAGPPFLTDDFGTTEKGHFEVQAFTHGAKNADGVEGAFGIDASTGVAGNFEIGVVLPLSYENPVGEPTRYGVTNFVVGGKYRFVDQEQAGVNISFAPSVSLPSLSNDMGSKYVSVTLPVWLGREG